MGQHAGFTFYFAMPSLKIVSCPDHFYCVMIPQLGLSLYAVTIHVIDAWSAYESTLKKFNQISFRSFSETSGFSSTDMFLIICPCMEPSDCCTLYYIQST